MFHSERAAVAPVGPFSLGDDGVPSFVLAEAREATDEELMLEGTHSQAYLSAMAARTAEAVKMLGRGKQSPDESAVTLSHSSSGNDDDSDGDDDDGRVLDSFRGKQLQSAGYSVATERAARAGTAALIDATLGVIAGVSSAAFVMCRPPTHHAVGNEERCRNASPKVRPTLPCNGPYYLFLFYFL